MSFYDERTDLMELFKAAESGDVSAMIQFVSYVSTMTSENEILQGLKTKYIDNLAKEQNAVGLIWKADELLKDYTINEGDIVFDAEYELKIADNFSGELMMFTAGTGEIDGNWIRHKSNVGIARSGENGYTLDAFGTAF